MDKESMYRLGLDQMNIDCEKSLEIFDPSTNNHIIFIHFLKSYDIICPLCGVVNDYENKGSKSQYLKYSSPTEDNITIKLFRRVFKCKSCSHHFKEYNTFLEGQRSITMQKDYQILEALKSFNVSYKSVAERFKVSPTYVRDLFDRKVDLNRLPLPNVMCVDEVYAKKLSYHHYCFIIYDPMNKKIIDVLPSRHLDKLEDYFYRISLTERDNVHFFSMDLYENYRIIARKCFRNALICADSFHVIKNISQAFHKIRIRIMKKYSYLKDQNDNYYWLFKDFFKLLTIDRSKLSYKRFDVKKSGQFMSTHDIVDYMLSIDKQLALAYELLHEYRNFNSKATINNAKDWLDEIIIKFKASAINEYDSIWKLLTNWHDEIINSFNLVNGRRISNGPMERANRDIKTLFRISYGSTNFPRIRNRIIYTMNSDAPILYHRKKVTYKRKGRIRGSYHNKK